MEEQFDPGVVKVMKAIRHVESGGAADPYNIIGDKRAELGGKGRARGAFQWDSGGVPLGPNDIPKNWVRDATSIGLPADAPMTKENQNKVAYTKIKQWKDQGRQPEEIAALWNGARKDKATGMYTYNNPEYGVKFRNALATVSGGSNEPASMPAQPPSTPTFKQKFVNNAVDTVTNMENVENDPRLGGLEKFTRKAGALAGGLLNTTGNAISSAVPALIRGAAGLVMPQEQAQKAPAQVAQAVPGLLQKGLEARFPTATTAVKGLMGTQLGQQIQQGVPAAAQAGQQAFNQFEQYAADRENNPVTNVLYESVAKPAVQVAGAVGEITGANALLRGGIRTLTRAPELVRSASNLFSPAERVIKTSIINDFSKGIKPLIRSNATTSQAKKYQEAVVGAVDTINQNKLNLQFVDDAGQVITGRTPENLKEMAESIEQTKKVIFNQYDELASRVGETGAKIRSDSVVKELETISNNKALSLSSPDTVRYAQEVAARYKNAGELTPSQTQEIIQNYNASLESFYRNPSYDTASRAMVDSMVANNLRNELDNTINSLTGDAYQALKNQYGQLKTIERDVSKAHLRDARKNIKGLVDFTDVFSGGQVLNGILSMNPASIAQGLTQKAIATYIKHLNNPNRYIKKLFENAEKLKGLTPVQ